jgi:hypothetical protein
VKAWLDEIDRAASGVEVLAGARDYCALLHPRELELLPEECRHIRLEAPGDIPRVRRRLSAGVEALDAPGDEVRALRDLLRFLSRAEERLGELRD